jgi:hypothetical protein
MNTVGLEILPLVTCNDSSSNGASVNDKPETAFFFAAERLIVVIVVPFFLILTVPVEFELALMETAISLLFSAIINGLLSDGLLEKNSSHLPVEPVPSNPHIVGPLDELEANIIDSSMAP